MSLLISYAVNFCLRATGVKFFDIKESKCLHPLKFLLFIEQDFPQPRLVFVHRYFFGLVCCETNLIVSPPLSDPVIKLYNNEENLHLVNTQLGKVCLTDTYELVIFLFRQQLMSHDQSLL